MGLSLLCSPTSRAPATPSPPIQSEASTKPAKSAAAPPPPPSIPAEAAESARKDSISAESALEEKKQSRTRLVSVSEHIEYGEFVHQLGCSSLINIVSFQVKFAKKRLQIDCLLISHVESRYLIPSKFTKYFFVLPVELELKLHSARMLFSWLVERCCVRLLITYLQSFLDMFVRTRSLNWKANQGFAHKNMVLTDMCWILVKSFFINSGVFLIKLNISIELKSSWSRGQLWRHRNSITAKCTRKIEFVTLVKIVCKRPIDAR